MNRIAPVLEWMKSNPVAVACTTVVLISLVVLFWLAPSKAASAVKEHEPKINGMAGQIRTNSSTRVQIPGMGAHDPPQSINIVVNPQAIDKLKGTYATMRNEYEAIEKLVLDLNKYGDAGIKDDDHTLVVNQAYLPNPNTDQDSGYEQVAKGVYIKRIDGLRARLNGGIPPGAKDIAAIKRLEEQKFKELTNVTTIPKQHESTIIRRTADLVEEKYKSRAKEIGIYCDEVRRTADQKGFTGPFHIGAWVASGTAYGPEAVWEGELVLWIQQDIVEAIVRANRDPSKGKAATVVDAPIKRLVGIRVFPGYLGIDTVDKGVNPRTDLGANLTGQAQNRKGLIAKTRKALNERLVDNFTASPTGRVSNPLYDVRLAELKVIVDSSQLPKVFNAIGSVNLMAVTGVKMKAVDEFEEFRKGYYYGTNVDVMELTLEIEAKWLREFTAGKLEDLAKNQTVGFMPDRLRYRLGVPTVDPKFAPKEKTNN